jgi:feruloyl-CoA synthase
MATAQATMADTALPPGAQPLKPIAYADMRALFDERPDGTIYLRHEESLKPYPLRLADRLVHWAEQTPDAVLIAERNSDGGWRKVTYAEALTAARAIGTALLPYNLGPERPVAILSGNSVDHAVVSLACLYAGIPWCAVSPPYALVSQDFGKLKFVMQKLTPGFVFAEDGAPFARAIAASVGADVPVAVSRNPPPGHPALLLRDLLAPPPSPPVDAAYQAIKPDDIVKFLLTSGSAGSPKAVVNTQRMWCANLAMIEQTITCLGERRPVLVDWLPWNHTFGGNHNFGMTVYHGGALYIDEGKPTPGGIAATVKNLREIAPTCYFNVPKGFESLVPYLRADADLRRSFFSQLQFNFFAGAALSQHVWDALDELSVSETGYRIPMLTGLGATETAPSALFNWPGPSLAGWLGLPVPGLEMKLVPTDGRYDARVRGPNVMPGYWREPQLTAAAFDEEGFYKFGDAVRFVDPKDRQQGLLFDGRISEDFKLATGTWVNVGALRTGLIRACAPLVRDVVIAGINRDYLAALILLDEDASRGVASNLPAKPGLGALAHHPAVRARISSGLAQHMATSTGSSTRIHRAWIIDTPPSLDLGEVTDKGSINQRAVLQARAAIIEQIYADALPDDVFEIGKAD